MKSDCGVCVCVCVHAVRCVGTCVCACDDLKDPEKQSCLLNGPKT